jgi:hypothetical protein
MVSMNCEGTVVTYATFLRKRIKRASKEDLVRWVMMGSHGLYASQMVEARTREQLVHYLFDRLAEGEWDGPGEAGPQEKGGG